MSSFLFGFALVLIVSLGARDQMLVARLSGADGAGRAGPGPLVAGIAAAALSALAMAWAGDRVAQALPPPARTMLVAFALGAAAMELAWTRRDATPREPTFSTFAAFLVLLIRQSGDAARFLLFALAAATALPGLVAAGGAIGSALALTLGHMAGTALERDWPLRTVRRVLAALALTAAIVAGLTARGLL